VNNLVAEQVELEVVEVISERLLNLLPSGKKSEIEE
jgi:hypothetical protein